MPYKSNMGDGMTAISINILQPLLPWNFIILLSFRHLKYSYNSFIYRYLWKMLKMMVSRSNFKLVDYVKR